ncbi:ABC transporter substrate-binding protein [Microlunatus speluncae]|uniref:ABC transporter substrate-binding protein n=1 Tax=Microlunatus speluncae TaxID=2594267 RepID=UPI00126619F1|nr:ABC transporter substrate-binding protein [Microlunatus speluncae]
MPRFTPSFRWLLAAALSLALVGCAAAGPEPAAESQPTRVVATDQGDVTIPADAQRIVVLNFALAGYLYALDVPVLATVSEDADTKEGTYSPLWAEDAKADGTTFLPWSADGFGIEAILALEPDLIIGGGQGFPLALAVKAYDQLSTIAPTVLVGNGLRSWQDQFSFLAEQVFDRPDRYAELVAGYEARAAEVRTKITPPPGPVGYLSYTGRQTVFGIVEDFGLPQELAKVGLEPAPFFADNDFETYGGAGDMFEISPELIDQAVTMPTVFVMGFNAETVDLEALKKDPIYARLTAFKGGHAYHLPYWALRADYHETMALLDEIETQFG